MRQSSLAKIGNVDAVSISIDREIASRYDDVKIVADNIDDVVAVANAAATTAAVAASIGAVTAVGSNIDAVVDVHNNTANIATIIDNFTNMNTVASNIADVNDVAGGMADILTASSNIADIIVAADNIAHINQVAADTAQINEIVATVVPNMAEILLADDKAAIATSMAATATTQAGLADTARVAAEAAQGIAETKANVASASAAVATTKANAASASASAAHNSELAAAAMLDAFDDRYLGSLVVDPVTDNDGQPLLDGTLYFNTSANVLKVYDVGTTTWYTIPQTLLSSLLDVQLTSTTVGDMLSWNGSKWVNTSSVQKHITNMNNPHAVTKAQVGLSNVDNTSDVNKPVSTAQATAIGLKVTANSNITAGTATKITYDAKGLVTSGTTLAASDIPSLDASKITTGTIAAARLPSYVDDVIEGTNLAAFPVTGETGKIYIALDTNKTYRWSGSAYVYITSGAVDSVAGKTGVITLTKADVGLNLVDNTTDLSKPISTATQTALNLKANLASPTFTGTVNGITKTMVGLSNVDNTSDVTKNVLSATKLTTPRAIALTGDVTGTADFDGSAGISIATTVANDSHSHAFANLASKPTTISGYGITDAINVSQKGVANGVATLDASGLVPVGQLPSYVDDVLEYTNLDMFPAVGEPGKIYVALNTNKTYRWSGTAYIYITSGAVDSVAGKTGVVSLVKADVGLSNVDNTSDLLKPISTATQTALNLKANLVSPTLTGTPTAPTAAVGTNTTQLATTAFVKAEIANDSTVVHKTGNETIAGVKTFSSSPIVPNPTTNTQAANKAYVDNKILQATNPEVYTGPYGLNWDETSDVYLRTGSTNYKAIQSLMRRCVMNDNGTVNYYLHPHNSNYKADGTAADLTGASGNVMVEVPKFYYKYNYNTTAGVVHEHSISLTPLDGYTVHDAFVRGGVEMANRYYPAYLGYSTGSKLLSRSGVYPTVNQTRAQFRTLARANGTGWEQIDFLLYEAITLLMVIEYGTMNIQSALGQGRTALTGGTWAGGSLIGINGLSNGVGNGTANVSYAGSADDAAADGSFMTYRGCENFFGNVWRFVDGINCNGSNSKLVYLNMNPATYADSVITGDYVSIGVTSAAASGYVRKLGNTRKGFIPTDITGGTSANGTTDYYHTSTTVDTLTLVGGYAYSGLDAGPLQLYVNNAPSLSNVSVGAGVSR